MEVQVIPEQVAEMVNVPPPPPPPPVLLGGLNIAVALLDENEREIMQQGGDHPNQFLFNIQPPQLRIPRFEVGVAPRQVDRIPHDSLAHGDIETLLGNMCIEDDILTQVMSNVGYPCAPWFTDAFLGILRMVKDVVNPGENVLMLGTFSNFLTLCISRMLDVNGTLTLVTENAVSRNDVEHELSDFNEKQNISYVDDPFDVNLQNIYSLIFVVGEIDDSTQLYSNLLKQNGILMIYSRVGRANVLTVQQGLRLGVDILNEPLPRINLESWDGFSSVLADRKVNKIITYYFIYQG